MVEQLVEACNEAKKKHSGSLVLQAKHTLESANLEYLLLQHHLDSKEKNLKQSEISPMEALSNVRVEVSSAIKIFLAEFGLKAPTHVADTREKQARLPEEVLELRKAYLLLAATYKLEKLHMEKSMEKQYKYLQNLDEAQKIYERVYGTEHPCVLRDSFDLAEAQDEFKMVRFEIWIRV